MTKICHSGQVKNEQKNPNNMFKTAGEKPPCLDRADCARPFNSSLVEIIMKNKILIIIYVICSITILGALSTIATSDSFLEKTLSVIIGMLCIVIIGGVWTRNEVARKIAVYYFGINAIFTLIIGVIGILIIVHQGEYTTGLIAFVFTAITVTLYVYIIRTLNSSELENEFN